MNPGRRAVLALAALLPGTAGAQAGVAYPMPGPRPLRFPEDHGSHPGFRTEWWYLTGWVEDAPGRGLGIQITFFRSRPGVQETGRSRFAPEQLLFAHAALADLRHGRLRHDQRAARAGFGLAEAATGTTAVHIDDWSLVLAEDHYRARIQGRGFAFDLRFRFREPPWLQGDAGLSRKGVRPGQASHYYSRPRLAVTGTVAVEGHPAAVSGRAWLDHEWSSQILDARAAGWDWTGVDLDDGGALMAFRIRDAAGRPLWAGGGHRRSDGVTTAFREGEVRFTPSRTWASPRTGTRYPVAMRVETPALDVDLVPVMDDQELDSRASVGTVYWEGAVQARVRGVPAGRGYLELTGYGQPLRL